MFATMMNDDEKGKRLTENGTYADRHLNDVRLNSQEMFFAMAYSNAEKAQKKEKTEKENNRIEVFTKHVVEEYEAELNLFDESSGTKKLFGLLPFIAKSLLNGTTLVIDELDAKIHPVLLRYLIMTFSNMEKNKKGAQLIFTSHDLSTMNSDVFRRDEIWFVAKEKRQNSKLYFLVEFKNEKGEAVRKDAKFDKQYLEGKYGADPYLRKIIDWGSVNG